MAIFPHIPIVYTGQNYSYTTLLGEKTSVPYFKALMPIEYKTRMSRPSVKKTYYFANVSNKYEASHFDLSIIPMYGPEYPIFLDKY